MPRFNVIMTSPRLAAPAVELLERAGCAIHYMEPFPSADAVTELTRAIQADAILTRQGPVNAAAMAASPRLKVVARHGVGIEDVSLAKIHLRHHILQVLAIAGFEIVDAAHRVAPLQQRMHER